MGSIFLLVHVFLLPSAATLWLAAAGWTRWDARRRLRNGAGIRAATGAALLFPVGGAVLWAIIRPAETLTQRRERRLRQLLLLAETPPGRRIPLLQPAEPAAAPEPVLELTA